MLMYLNGYENKNVAPNDNYSRELYELLLWEKVMVILRMI